MSASVISQIPCRVFALSCKYDLTLKKDSQELPNKEKLIYDCVTEVFKYLEDFKNPSMVNKQWRRLALNCWIGRLTFTDLQQFTILNDLLKVLEVPRNLHLLHATEKIWYYSKDNIKDIFLGRLITSDLNLSINEDDKKCVFEWFIPKLKTIFKKIKPFAGDISCLQNCNILLLSLIKMLNERIFTKEEQKEVKDLLIVFLSYFHSSCYFQLNKEIILFLHQNEDEPRLTEIRHAKLDFKCFGWLKTLSDFSFQIKEEHTFIFDWLLPKLEGVLKDQERNHHNIISENSEAYFTFANRLLKDTGELSPEEQKKARETAENILRFFTDESNPCTWLKLYDIKDKNSKLFYSRHQSDDTKLGCAVRLAAHLKSFEMLKLIYGENKPVPSYYFKDVIDKYIDYFDQDCLPIIEYIFIWNKDFEAKYIGRWLRFTFQTKRSITDLILEHMPISIDVIKTIHALTNRQPTMFPQIIAHIKTHPKHQALDWESFGS